jgi:hypothetical protein
MEDRTQPNGYNVAGLLREIEGLKAERDLFRDGFLRLYGSVTRAYSARGKAEKKAIEKYARTVEGVDPEDRPGYLATVGEVMIEALAETPASSSPSPAGDGPDPLRYDLRNLNDRRRDAILAYMQKTGKATITTQEARHVLQTAENRVLDRKAVWRALRAARDRLGATLVLFGGVLRLIVPSSPRPGDHRHVAGVSGERATSPRPRRWAVPWDGAE